MAFPTPFNTFVNPDAVTNFIATNGMILSKDVTIHDSPCIQFPTHTAQYVTEADRTNIKAGVSAIAGRMITEVLSLCAPTKIQLWVLGKNFVETAKAAVETIDEINVLLDFVDKYQVADLGCTEDAEITAYVAAVSAFRAALVGHTIPGMEDLISATPPTISVGASLNEFQDMLRVAYAQWRSRQEGGPVVAVANPTVGAAHLEEVRMSMNNDEQVWMFPFARNKTNLRGRMLVTTAILADETGDLRRMVTRSSTSATSPNRAFSLLILADIAAAAEQAGVGNAVKRMQSSNIDCIFLLFFYCFKVVKLSIPDFYQVLRAIYYTCRKMRGNAQVEAMITTYAESIAGVATLKAKISKNVNIYCPAWILTYGRLYDVVSIFGGFDCANTGTIVATYKKPAVSPRYYHLIKRDTGNALVFLTQLFAVERRYWNLDGATDIQGISQALKIMQQMFMGRLSPAQCTLKVTGNALKVTIIP